MSAQSAAEEGASPKVARPLRVAVRRTLLVVPLFAVLALFVGWRARARRLAEASDAVAPPERVPHLVIVGDSRPHCGIAPRLMQAAFGEDGFAAISGFNYAVDGSDVLHHRSNVAALADKASELGVVVWAPNPLSFDGSRLNNRLELLRASDLASLRQSGAPLELLLDVGTMQVFPPYRERPGMKDWIEERSEGIGKRLLRVQGTIGLVVEPEPKRRIYTSHEDGQISFRVIAEWDVRFPIRLKTYETSYKSLKLSDWHFEEGRSLARTVREHRGTLVILEMPSAPAYRAAFGSDEKHLKWRERLRRIAADEGAIFLSHADHYGDDHAFGDPGHMSEETAADYSAFLAHELAKLEKVREALGKKGPSQQPKERR